MATQAHKKTETDVKGKRTDAAPASEPMLFLVMEANRPTAPPARWRLGGAGEVTIGRGEQRVTSSDNRGKAIKLELRVPDSFLSGAHARLRPRGELWEIEDTKSKNGTMVSGVRTKRATLHDGDVIEVGRTFFLFRDARSVLPAELRAAELRDLAPPAKDLATVVPELARAFADLVSLAKSAVSVVLGGETGTGKEVVARAIHELSARKGEFVAVDCGALPENLIESQIFGHRKGSFSGATHDHPGLARAADGGTLFLDEIGDLPLAAQTAFLRVLQAREVLPVGGTKPLPVDVRLMCATHRDLRALVKRGAFRADLYERLNGFHLELPPLRERREDLGLLVGALLARLAPDRRAAVTFDAEAVRTLLDYDFPGNVRELEKILGTALVLAKDKPIGDRHFAPHVQQPNVNTLEDEQLERTVRATLEEHGGNISAVARVLHKDRKQILRWVDRFGINLDALRRG